MSKRHHPTLRNNCTQLALIALSFVLCISLLESKGMIVWAQRLEVSPLQQTTLRTMESVDNFWSAVAKPITSIRPQALQYLNQHGWSDLPPDTTSLNDKNLLDPVETTTAPSSTPDKSSHSTPPQGDQQPETAPPQTTSPETTPPKDTPPDHELGTPSLTHPTQTWLPIVIQPDAAMKLTALPQASSSAPRRVVLAGDSMMAVGLGAQLQRDLAPYKNSIVTIKAFRSATGLARPDVFDWQKEYPLMVGTHKPHVVIVAIGANDTQNLEVNRKVLTLGSPQWREVYAQRLTSYLDMLTQDGAVVLWLKLPPMRPNKYNQNINVVNEVAQTIVAQNPRAIWWDTSSRYVDSKGKFQEFAVITQGQRPVRIRQADGIHFSDEGAKLITGDILNWINPEPPKPATPSAPATPTTPVATPEQATPTTQPAAVDTAPERVIQPSQPASPTLQETLSPALPSP